VESISEDFLQQNTPVQPGVPEISSELPILQPDAEMLKEIGLPNTDIVSSADTLLSTSNNRCDNCKIQIKLPTSQSGVPLPEDAGNTAGNGFTPSNSPTPTATDKVEEEINRQRSSRLDFVRHEVDQAIKLYHSTHPAPPQRATINNVDINGSTGNYYTLDSCNGMDNMRPLVDLGSLAVTGCVQKSTLYVDMGHLRSQRSFIDPIQPRANTTLAELNQEPTVSLDPHHSATAPYHHTPSLKDVDGNPHSDSFTRAIAPVYCDWNCWNDPEYTARMLQPNLEDFDEILHNVTAIHEQEQREEEKRKKRLCAGKTYSNPGTSNMVTSCHNQCDHTSGKWVPDWSKVAENEQEKQEAKIISIPLTKVTPRSASKCNNRKVLQEKKWPRKRKLEDRYDVTGEPQQRKKHTCLSKFYEL